MNILKSKKGAAMEMMLMFIVICVAFSVTITTTALCMSRSTNTAKRWISEKIKMEQASEYFVRTIHEMNELDTGKTFPTVENFESAPGVDNNEIMTLRQLVDCGYTWETTIGEMKEVKSSDDKTVIEQEYELKIKKKNTVVMDVVIRAESEVNGTADTNEITYTIEKWSY